MCTNYRAPDDDPGISELKIGIGDLFRRDPWEIHAYADYGVPIVHADGDGAAVEKATGQACVARRLLLSVDFTNASQWT